MLKILVAEDEMLVRKGIIGIINWKDYNAEIVGEADSGTAVLDFLSNYEVDLLLTDLTMPNLSGIEYLKEVRHKFPNVKIVVITMHRDFDMIQQAMRLGVSDYITKEQIQKDNFDTTIKKIFKNVFESESIINTRNKYGDKYPLNEALAICALNENKLELIIDGSTSYNENFIKINQKYWLTKYSEEIIKELEKYSDDIYTILACNVKNKDYVDIVNELEKFENKELFYDYEPNKFIYKSNLYESNKRIEKERNLEDISAAFSNIESMNNDKIYNDLINRIKDLNLSNDELQVYCYQLYIGWMQYTGNKINEYFESINKIKWWYQWREWFDENRKVIKEKVCGESNEDINQAMISKAIKYIEDNYKLEISVEDMLKVTNMSKSHFSKCFKKYTDKSFVSYLNDYRIDKSKELLCKTNQSVSWIAEYVGFSSERYFRRVFINKVGVKPIEFRNNIR